MTFAELQIGQRFTNDERLIGFWWRKTAKVKTGSGDFVNAVSHGGQFVFFADEESVILIETESNGPKSRPRRSRTTHHRR